MGDNRKNLYEMIREQIKHEDELVNQRQNWLLLSQGFLLALATAVLTREQPFPLDEFTKWLLFLIAILGILLALFSHFGIIAAFRSLQRLRNIWYKKLLTANDISWIDEDGIELDDRELQKKAEKLEKEDMFPPITWVGKGPERALSPAVSPAVLITVTWGVIICIFAPSSNFGGNTLVIWGANWASLICSIILLIIVGYMVYTSSQT